MGQAARVRLPKRQDLVNVPEFEDVAKLALDAAVFATIAGGDRAAFDRMTFRPRMMVPTVDLDMSVDLFGETHFTPIVVGPVANQRRYHADGEMATLRGAAAAHAGVIVSSRSSVPVVQLAAKPGTPLWYSAYAGDADARTQIDQARAAGCTVMCIASEGAGAPDWKRVGTVTHGLAAPFVIKGVMTLQDTRTAIDHGASGIVVSDYGGGARSAGAPLDVLASIVDACAGKATVLVDGSFRRGSDVAKALALGARGVLLARPVMWGLAAYGADGVQGVLEMLQSDLARTMGALGAPDLKSLTREFVRIHRR